MKQKDDKMKGEYYAITYDNINKEQDLVYV